MTAINELRVVVVGVDGIARPDLWVLDAGHDCLSHLQEAVEGLVDCVALAPHVDLWVNDEGLYRCEPNPVVTVMAHALSGRDLSQPLFGPAVFTGGVDDEGETLGLSEERQQTLVAAAEFMAAVEADTVAEVAAIGRRIADRVR